MILNYLKFRKITETMKNTKFNHVDRDQTSS